MSVSHVGAEAAIMVCLGQTSRRHGCEPQAQREQEQMGAAAIHLPGEKDLKFDMTACFGSV